MDPPLRRLTPGKYSDGQTSSSLHSHPPTRQFLLSRFPMELLYIFSIEFHVFPYNFCQKKENNSNYIIMITSLSLTLSIFLSLSRCFSVFPGVCFCFVILCQISGSWSDGDAKG